MQADQELIQISDWMRRTTIDFFQKNKDAMMVKGYVTLSNPAIVTIMSTTYEPLMRDTHFISCKAREILLDHASGEVIRDDELLRAEMEINAHVKSVHDYFDTRIAQAEQKLALHGITTDSMQRKERNYETKICSPTMTHFFNILYKADIYLSQLHYLWMTAELADDDNEAMRVRLNAERDVRHQILAMCRLATQHFTLVRRLCMAVKDQRTEQRRISADRDRQITIERAERQRILAEREARAKAKKIERHDKRVEKLADSVTAAQVELDRVAASAAEEVSPLPA